MFERQQLVVLLNASRCSDSSVSVSCGSSDQLPFMTTSASERLCYRRQGPCRMFCFERTPLQDEDPPLTPVAIKARHHEVLCCRAQS